MNDSDRESPYDSPRRPAEISEPRQGVAEIFERMSAEASRRAGAGRVDRPPRGALGNLWLAAVVAMGLLTASVFVYGIYRFRDAPIRETATGYVSKAGAPKTRDEYEAFEVWERTIATLFPAFFVVAFGYEGYAAWRRKKAGGETPEGGKTDGR